MSWRVVVISNSAKADYKLDYLIVRIGQPHTYQRNKRAHYREHRRFSYRLSAVRAY